MAAKKIIMICILSTVMTILASVVPTEGLQSRFYHSTCPSAESIVRGVVAKAVTKNPGMAAGLIRLQFHDCIVRGCDGSILLNANSTEEPAEKDSGASPLLRGFDVIDEAKAEIEAACPSTVSCADILAFAARDSAALVGGIHYTVPGGRRDGNISRASEVPENIPPLTSDVSAIRDYFKSKGLTLREAVALSGAHSIGVAPCGAFFDRISADPSVIDPKFAAFLKKKCASDPGTVNLDVVTPNRLDIQYYKNLGKKMGLLDSDQGLINSSLTVKTVNQYMRNRTLWEADFAAAMVHMGSIGVLTGVQGDVRRNCSLVN